VELRDVLDLHLVGLARARGQASGRGSRCAACRALIRGPWPLTAAV
jgi:hypothetical protein